MHACKKLYNNRPNLLEHKSRNSTPNHKKNKQELPPPHAGHQNKPPSPKTTLKSTRSSPSARAQTSRTFSVRTPNYLFFARKTEQTILNQTRAYMAAPFQATTPNGRVLKLTNEGWRHICTVHPELQGELEKVNRVMKSPDFIKQGNKADTFILYKFFPRTIVSPRYLALVTKYLNTEGIVLIGYFTQRIRKGEVLWRKQ